MNLIVAVTMNPGIAMIVAFTLLIDLWAIITLARRPASAFQDAGKSKGFWIITIGVGIFLLNIGFFVSVWYLLIVDPKVQRMQQYGAGTIGFPGGFKGQ